MGSNPAGDTTILPPGARRGHKTPLGVAESVSRYSLLYMNRGKRQPDSKRLRVRLAVNAEELIGPLGSTYATEFGRYIGLRLGVRVSVGDLSGFFQQSEVQDVLDSITLAYEWLMASGSNEEAADWLTAAREAVEEEHLQYRVDDRGVVRPYVDQEMEDNRASALLSLSTPRFGEARSDFEAAFRHLRSGEGKQAIRMMFPAVEVAAKVLFPGRFSAFGPTDVDRSVKPLVERKYAGNVPAVEAGKRLLESFKDWIIASHQYRHGPEMEAAAEPPQELVVAHLSAGSTFLRWMIEIASEEA